MVLVDMIWAGMVYAFMLVFAAIIGFVVLKIGIVSFKSAMGTIIAARGIENIEGVARNPNYRITEEDEFEIITSNFNSLIKDEAEKNHYTNYVYMRLFKIIETLLYTFSSKFTKVETELSYYIEHTFIQLSKIKNTLSHADSLKDSIKAKTKRSHYTKYAYMQLFKK